MPTAMFASAYLSRKVSLATLFKCLHAFLSDGNGAEVDLSSVDCSNDKPAWNYGPWSEWSTDCGVGFRFRGLSSCPAMLACTRSCGEPDQVSLELVWPYGVGLIRAVASCMHASNTLSPGLGTHARLIGGPTTAGEGMFRGKGKQPSR